MQKENTKESKENAYLTCELAGVCYGQHIGTYESIFHHVDCFNMECLMAKNPEQARKNLGK